MRILGGGLLAVLAISFLAADGISQYCPSGGAPCLGAPMNYGGPVPSYNMPPPSPYPGYPSYGVWPASYQVPPYLAGGPAPGYTYPYPWYGYNPYPGTRSYIAPPYPQPTTPTYAYTASYRPTPPPVVTYYSPNPQSYLPARSSSGSRFATDSTSIASPPAKASATPATKHASAKKAWTPPATKETSPFSTDNQQAKEKQPSLLHRLLFWQKSKD